MLEYSVLRLTLINLYAIWQLQIKTIIYKADELTDFNDFEICCQSQHSEQLSPTRVTVVRFLVTSTLSMNFTRL